MNEEDRVKADKAKEATPNDASVMKVTDLFCSNESFGEGHSPPAIRPNQTPQTPLVFFYESLYEYN